MEDLIHIQKTFEKSLSSTRKSTIENLKIVRLKTVTSLIVTSQQYFMDCEFIDCNLSMTQLRGTSLKTVLAIANYWELNFKVVQTCLELIFGIAFWITLPLLTRKCPNKFNKFDERS
jgi:hypothetical protein